MFGRIADVIGRKKVYVTVAVIMIIGAIASALAPGFIFLVVARLVLGFGIGGDYPVSAVFMSEYSNRKDRGRLVGSNTMNELVFPRRTSTTYCWPEEDAA